MFKITSLIGLFGMALFSSSAAAGSDANERFENLAARYVDGSSVFGPVGATQMGDHRFDHRLDDVSDSARELEADFYREFLLALEGIDRSRLSRANQIDAELLRHQLEAALWRLTELEEWAWNPLVYTNLAGGSIYGLLARDFAPLDERLGNVASRLEKLPRFLEQVRATLQPERVPEIHAQTAVRQNRGVLSILDNMVRPAMGSLAPGQRETLQKAMETAKAAMEEHQVWLEEQLLPNAKGNFRIGAELFDSKLAFALHTPLSRQQVRERAEREFHHVRDEIYAVARTVYNQAYPYTEFPDEPGENYRQAVIRAALELAYQQRPGREEIVDTAKEQLERATRFVREKDLVSVPDDPVEIIVMPEFQRGVSVAYCDSPGPLDVGLKTFYAVAPLPEDWTEEQVRTFLREYNLFSLEDLTMHEAMPGHFLQLAHSNRYPSTLRAMLSSGPFIEGWAVYAERMMVDAGYNGNDPLQRLIMLKWYLRAVTNAILDQAIHVDGMSRDEAMKLMVEGAFQEEREAALKWVRAQLTSAQLSTYFVGYQEHADLRQEFEAGAGDAFDLKAYHDRLLSFGSPAVQFVRALMLELSIPREGS
jgi:uncharacterized protein (DUF885 family)